MSTTTRSPASIVRPDSSWCGLAPFGPEPDDREVDPDVALGEDRRGDVGAHLGLGAPDPQPLPHPGVHPVDRGTGERQLLDLRRRLHHAQPVDDRARELERRARQRPLDAEGVLGPRAGPDADPRRRRPETPGGGAGEQRERVVGLVPGQHLEPEPAGRAGLDHRRLQAGHDEERLTDPRHGQRGQPLHRVRVVAGEVAQVGAGRQHEQIHPGVRGELPRGVHPVDRHERIGRGSRGHHTRRLATRTRTPHVRPDR